MSIVWREDGADSSFRAVISYQTAALVTFGACLTVCACAVSLLAMWTLPTQGDFCRASYCFVLPRFLREQRGVSEYIASGIIQYTSIVYSNWSGRWAGVGIETLLLSKTPQPFAYPWLILTLLATQFLILYFAVHEFIVGFRGALYLSAVIASVYWAVMPSATQGIFWILGIVESQLPLTLVSLLFAFVLSRRPTDTNPSNILATIAAAVLGFLTPAFHELAGGILLLALSIITVAAFVSKSSLRMLWLIVWTASALGFLVVFVAPGNAIRMASTANRGNYATVIRGTLSTARHYILPWFLDFKLWLLAALLWLDPHLESLRRRLSGLSSLPAIVGFLIVWISLVMVAIGAAIWNTGGQPPGRTMNMIYGMFLMGWIALAFLVKRPLPRFPFHPVHRTVILSTALLMLSALVITSDNTALSIRDIVRGRARAWNAELHQRYTLLKSAGPNTNVVVPPLSEYANTSILARGDISEDANYWANQCLAHYYGVASARRSKIPK